MRGPSAGEPGAAGQEGGPPQAQPQGALVAPAKRKEWRAAQQDQRAGRRGVPVCQGNVGCDEIQGSGWGGEKELHVAEFGAVT